MTINKITNSSNRQYAQAYPLFDLVPNARQ